MSFHSFYINAQSLGGYSINDFLTSAVHPFNCSADYVTGPPDDSTWVNFANGDIMTGNFGGPSRDTTGFELLLETSYHADNYNVRMLLSTNIYSSIHNVQQADWTQITDTTWQHLFTNCFAGTQGVTRYIVPLDYNLHFGLLPTDTVIGIEITFLTTQGSPDFAGAYIIGAQPCDSVYLGNDTALCQGSTLLLNATTPNATYLWQDNSTNATFNVNQPGLYWVEVTAGSCISSDTILITYNPLPLVNIGNDTTLCAGTNLTLNATTTNASYFWQNNSINPTLTVNQTGTYWVGVTVNNCTSIDSIQVNFLLGNLNLGNDTVLCTGSALMLNATTANASYLWQDNSTNPTFLVNQSGLYWVEVSQNNCIIKDSIQVDFLELLNLNIGNDTSLCIGSSILLDASMPNAIYQWQDNSTNPMLNVSQPGLYWVTVTVNNCIETDSILITNITVPPLDLGPDTTVCAGSIVYLDGTTPNVTYRWQDNSSNPAFFVNNTGLYWLEISINNCKNADSIQVNYQTLPYVNLGPDTLLCLGSELILNASSPNSTYLWQDNSTNPSFTVSKEGTYWVEVTSKNCSKSDTINIETGQCDFIIPNAFSPNADGLNDEFKIINSLNIDILNFSIFNRWGQQIFSIQGSEFGWDGSFKGQACENGTYFYLIKYKTKNNSSQLYKSGDIELIR